MFSSIQDAGSNNLKCAHANGAIAAVAARARAELVKSIDVNFMGPPSELSIEMTDARAPGFALSPLWAESVFRSQRANVSILEFFRYFNSLDTTNRPATCRGSDGFS